MEITVSIFGLIRHIVRDSPLKITLEDGSTVGDLINRLADSYGERFREVVFDGDGKLQNSVEVFVNDRALESLAEKLEEGKNGEIRIFVLSPVAGGQN
jgi:molybdopterin converting factor small subunit